MKGYCHQNSAGRLHSAALESESSIDTQCFTLNIVYKSIQTQTIIQKKAIRIITASSYISHTEPLFKQLNLLKVEDILTLQELKFYFKYNQGILPKYLQNWNFIPNSKIHNHNTRNITTLHTFKTKHEFAKKTLKYNLPYTINNTPHIVKDKVNTHSIQGFSLYVKQYLIRKYNTNCISRNCYICEQNA